MARLFNTLTIVTGGQAESGPGPYPGAFSNSPVDLRDCPVAWYASTARLLIGVRVATAIGASQVPPGCSSSVCSNSGECPVS